MHSDHRVIRPKNLIEVALPLDAINAAGARETSILHGYPSMLHLWWVRRPLAAAIAVIFSQLVNEDDSHDGPYYIRRPFDREPGWGVSSINYNLSDLLQKAESP
jgi:adenine-specific DNA methylase